MRVVPVALAGLRLPPAEVASQACAASRLTHGHPRAQAACAVYCLAAQTLLLGEVDRQRALEKALAGAWANLPPNVRVELYALRSYEQRTGTGYVLDTFWSAWDAFRAGHSYARVVERAILYGGDTDTTAAVAGALAGSYWGIDGIPHAWLGGMRGREIVQPLLRRLVAAIAPGESDQGQLDGYRGSVKLIRGIIERPPPELPELP